MQDSFTFLGYICISLICLIFSSGISMIISKQLNSKGAHLDDINRGIIAPFHKKGRIFAYIIIIVFGLGCLTHINIMAVLFQEAATNTWLIVWMILMLENLFLVQPIKALIICAFASPDLCVQPIRMLTGIEFLI